jgi:hypothetical protein
MMGTATRSMGQVCKRAFPSPSRAGGSGPSSGKGQTDFSWEHIAQIGRDKLAEARPHFIALAQPKPGQSRRLIPISVRS